MYREDARLRRRLSWHHIPPLLSAPLSPTPTPTPTPMLLTPLPLLLLPLLLLPLLLLLLLPLPLPLPLAYGPALTARSRLLDARALPPSSQ